MFTCTEHFGKEDLNILILHPLVTFIIEGMGRQVVCIRDEYKEEAQQAALRAIRANPNNISIGGLANV